MGADPAAIPPCCLSPMDGGFASRDFEVPKGNLRLDDNWNSIEFASRLDALKKH